MPARFAATENAIEKGLETSKPASAVKLIEAWEAELNDLDIPGAKGIAGDLERLKKLLEKDEPDGDKVKALLGKLGEATTKIAAKAHKENVKPKLESLGEGLSGAA